MSAEHLAGVVIPPDKGDANYEGGGKHIPFLDDGVTYCGWTTEAGTFDGCGETWPCAYIRGDDLTPDAPETPHAPASAPNTTPRGSADAADGSEALRGALAEEWARHSTPPLFCDDDGDARCKCGTWLTYRDNFDRHRLAALLPLVLAYGREQAAQALRGAVSDVEHRYPAIHDPDPLSDWSKGVVWMLKRLTVRADDLGRQA